jgi:hypothetical protein
VLFANTGSGGGCGQKPRHGGERSAEPPDRSEQTKKESRFVCSKCCFADATAEQLHLEYLSERMLSELSMRQMTSCEQTLLEMKSLLPSNDVAMRLLLDRVAKYKVNNEKWTDYELLKEK